MPNPTPTFADDVLAWASGGKRHEVFKSLSDDRARKLYLSATSTTATLIQRASRFVLDDGFLDHVVDVASTLNSAAKIEAVMALARAPHPVTWFEFDAGRRIAQQAATGTMPQYAPEELRTHSRRAGFLIEALNDDGTKFAVRYLTSETNVGDYWTGDHLAMPMLLVDLEATAPVSSLGGYLHVSIFDAGTDEDNAMRVMPYGMRSSVGREEGRADIRYTASGSPRMLAMCGVALSDHVGAFLLGMKKLPEKFTQAFLQDHVEGRGDLRFIAAALAVINRLPVRYDVREPKGSRWVNQRPRPYMSHRTITLTVPATRGLSMFGKLLQRTMTEITRRAHEVRGHWRTIPDLSRPGATREVWVKSHQRGDATKGFVRTDYVVQTNADKRTEH